MNDEDNYREKFNLIKCFSEINFKDIEENVIDYDYTDEKYMFMRKLLFRMETALSDSNSDSLVDIIRDIHDEIKPNNKYKI